MMTDYPPQNPPWLAPPTGPDAKEAPPLSEKQTPTSKPNAGDEHKAFKLTNLEREIIGDALAVHSFNMANGRYEGIINAIEAIINQGWQTCDCGVDKAGANV